jgi:hypothetical protein
MKKSTKLLLLAVILAAMTYVSNQTLGAAADDPLFLRATFSSHTNDDNKDHDTGVYVKVWTVDGSTIMAHADNRDSSGSDATEYNDGSDHQFNLDVDAAGLKKSSARRFKVQVCQQTNGHDTWKFNARVTLVFSDNSNLVASKDGIILVNDGACADFSAQ